MSSRERIELCEPQPSTDPVQKRWSIFLGCSWLRWGNRIVASLPLHSRSKCAGLKERGNECQGRYYLSRRAKESFQCWNARGAGHLQLGAGQLQQSGQERRQNIQWVAILRRQDSRLLETLVPAKR